jgi:murein DD-endopeptidase MepM/ murein hydrolase activator NlpD
MTHFLKRTAVILAGASSLAACTTYQPFEGAGAGSEPLRPNYPIQLPAPPPAAPPSPAAPRSEAPVARPTEPIEGRSLPPAVSNQPAYVTPSTPPGPSGPPRAYQPPPTTPYRPLPPPPPAESAPPPRAYEPPPEPAPPPRPRTQTVTKTSVTGKVVDVEGPRVSYTVEKKDNLIGIARKLDTDVETLAKDNKLKSPYVLHPGQELKGPVTHRKAYVVGSGDTLYAIARRFSVTARALAEENGLRTGASLRPGQKIRLPEDYKDKGPIKTTTRVTLPPEPAPAPRPAPRPAPPPAPAYTPTAPPYNPPPSVYSPPPPPPPPPAAPAPSYSRPTPPPPPPTTPYHPLPNPPAPAARPSTPAPPAPSTPAPIVPSSPTLTDQQISELGRGRFIWPVRGEIISPFGPKPTTGQRNDGVNIRAMAGEPVRAAAAGDVVYAGDQVPGFGNLVLIKHADGWVTAYGHLARSDVKMQQKVVQGQQVGTVGSTGGVTEPQLHFEVRYAPTPADRARPVDPNLVLPK